MSSRLMRALVLDKAGKTPQLSVKEVPIPQPAHGEVLVRVESAPINPSDLLYMEGRYAEDTKEGVTPGFEGSGVVVESGGGLLGWSLKGKRVACTITFPHGGTYAEYIVTQAYRCAKLPNNVSFNEGACMFVNPLTVVMFQDVISSGKHRAAIHTAAASALGKMFARWGVSSGFPIVHVVRREEQVQTLRELGAEYIVNTSEEGWEQEMDRLCEDLNVTVGFDAVAGELTGKVLNSVKNNGVVYVYGVLSMEGIQINPMDLIAKNKRAEGLYLGTWLVQKNILKQINSIWKVQGMLGSLYKTDVAREVPLEEASEGIEYYKNNMSRGKVLIRPNLR